MTDPRASSAANARISVSDCARCGGSHELWCLQLAKPCESFTHWAQCPTTLEPILVRFDD